MTSGPTLAIDASTYVGTVAVLRDGALLSEGEAAMRGEREERLMPAVAQALEQANIAAGELARVVCGAGPGSFTSLRIAASIAKGLCLAHGVPLFAVPSLALMAPRSARPPGEGRWLAVLDAMRGDVYAALLETDREGIVRSFTELGVIERAGAAAAAARANATLLGAGEQAEASPRAGSVVRLAPTLISDVSLATWEPRYGRLAEAQVKWEAAHGRALASG